MKKTLSLILLVVLMVTLVASCKQDPPHSHTFSEDWKYDNVRQCKPLA